LSVRAFFNLFICRYSYVLYIRYTKNNKHTPFPANSLEPNGNCTYYIFDTGNSTSSFSVYLFFLLRFIQWKSPISQHSINPLPLVLKTDFVVAVWTFQYHSNEVQAQEHHSCLSVWFIVWLLLVLFELFITWLSTKPHGRRTWPEKFWSVKGISVNVKSASEYVTFALSSKLSISKEESLLLIWMCCPLNVGCSWRRIDRKGKYSSRPAICSKIAEAKLCLLPASAYALHEFSLGIYCDPSY